MPRAESSDLPVTRRVTIQSVTLRVTIRPRLWPVSYSLRTQCVALPEFGQNGGPCIHIVLRLLDPPALNQ